MKHPLQVFLKTMFPPEWFKLRMAYKSLALGFEKVKMRPSLSLAFPSTLGH